MLVNATAEASTAVALRYSRRRASCRMAKTGVDLRHHLPADHSAGCVALFLPCVIPPTTLGRATT